MLPRVIIHNAISADGRLDHFDPDIGTYYELVATWNEQATLVGSNTVLAGQDTFPLDEDEQPEEDPTDKSEKPLLVIVDSGGRVRFWKHLLCTPYWRAGLALCSEQTPREYLDYLDSIGVAHKTFGSHRVDLRAALQYLADELHIGVVRVDSGGTLNGLLLRAGLVQEISLLVHPCLVGGVSPKSFFVAPDLEADARPIEAKLGSVEELPGGIVWLRYDVIGLD